MSQYQEEKYIRVRQEEKEKESFGDIQNEIAEQSKKSGSSSVYRVFSRQCSTFVFPNHIVRPKVTKISDAALARDGDKHRLIAKFRTAPSGR